MGTSAFRGIFKCLQPKAKMNLASMQICSSFGYNSLKEQSNEDSIGASCALVFRNTSFQSWLQVPLMK